MSKKTIWQCDHCNKESTELGLKGWFTVTEEDHATRTFGQPSLNGLYCGLQCLNDKAETIKARIAAITAPRNQPVIDSFFSTDPDKKPTNWDKLG